MQILIDQRAGTRIYDQIFLQIREQVILKSLEPDEILPSIRTLAKDLKVSFITTKRAYEELEKAGYIYTVPGKGSFIADVNEEFIREEKFKDMEKLIHQIAELARTYELSKEDIINMICFEMEENK